MDDVYGDLEHGYVQSLLCYLTIDKNGLPIPDMLERLIRYVEKLENK